MNERKLRRKLRKKAKRLLRWAKRHGVHYVDVSAFGDLDAGHAYCNPTESGPRVTVSYYNYETEK